MANILGTTKDDVLIGTPEDDLIRGLAGNDTIFAGNGFDGVSDGSGADTVYLGLDGGYILADAVDSTSRDTFFGSGNRGDSYLNYSESSSAIIADFRRGIVQGTAVGRDNVFDFDNIELTRYGDIFHGSNNANIVDGGGGYDRIYTYGGNDRVSDERAGARIVSGDGDDTIFLSSVTFERSYINSGSGNDTIEFGIHAIATVQCGTGDDYVYGPDVAGSIRVFGDDGNDELCSYAKALLSGGAGDDDLFALNGCRLIGGEGSDVFRTEIFGGRSVIVDFEDGFDRLAIENRLWQDVIENARDTINGVLVEIDGGELFLGGVTVAQLDAGDFI